MAWLAGNENKRSERSSRLVSSLITKNKTKLESDLRFLILCIAFLRFHSKISIHCSTTVHFFFFFGRTEKTHSIFIFILDMNTKSIYIFVRCSLNQFHIAKICFVKSLFLTYYYYYYFVPRVM